MGISESLILFAGFVFAHAAWNVSDLPKGELLVPIVMLEKDGKRELMRFEAETQVEAISQAKTWLEKNGNVFDAWVFAREGQVNEKGKYVDTLTVEVKGKNMTATVVLVRKFQPFSSGKFKLLGEPIFSVGGRALDDKTAADLSTVLRNGINTHPSAAKLWSGWNK